MSWLSRLAGALLGRQPVKSVEIARAVEVSQPAAKATSVRTPCRSCSRPVPIGEVDDKGLCHYCQRIEARWERRLARLRAEGKR